MRVTKGQICAVIEVPELDSEHVKAEKLQIEAMARIQQEEIALSEALNKLNQTGVKPSRKNNDMRKQIASIEQRIEKEKTNIQDIQNQLDAERDNIIPQLLDYIQGNSPEEINNSVEELKSRSQSILESAQAALTQQRRDQVGTRATLPPAGPLETNSEQRMPTAEEIAAMPMNEYAKVRSRILSNRAQGRTSGILG